MGCGEYCCFAINVSDLYQGSILGFFEYVRPMSR
jgi:hypothetical protein